MRIQDLERTHPDYYKQAKAREEFRALAQGGELWHETYRNKHLPKNALETHALYGDRLKLARYPNPLSGILSVVVHWMLEDPPVVENATPTATKFWEHADANGNNFVSVAANIFRKLLVDGVVYAWPDRDGQETRNKLDDESVRPYVTIHEADEVLNWKLTDKGLVDWAVIRTQSVGQESPTAPLQYTTVWTVATRTDITRYQYISNEAGLNPEMEVRGNVIPHGRKANPLLRLAVPTALHALYQYRDPVVAFIQADNRLQWNLHLTAFPLLVHKRRKGAGSVLDETIMVGPGVGVDIGHEDSVDFVEPAGNGTEALRSNRAEKLEEIHNVLFSGALGVGDTKRVVSGISKTRDWDALQIVMSAYSAVLGEFFERIFAGVTEVMGEEEGEVRVTGMKAWQKKSLQQLIETLVSTPSIQSVSPLFQKGLFATIARKVLKDHITQAELDEILKEIEEATHLDLLPPVTEQGGDNIHVRSRSEETTNGVTPQNSEKP